MLKHPAESSLPLDRHGSFKLLTPDAVIRIEQALQAVGEYGEVSLIVMKGRLRYIEITQSEKLQDPES